MTRNSIEIKKMMECGCIATMCSKPNTSVPLEQVTEEILLRIKRKIAEHKHAATQ